MRQSRLLAPTLREDPADAEVASHALLVRGGYIRPLAAGSYAFLPLGWRVLQRICAAIRSEMDATGAQEVQLPVVQNAELWRASGRWDDIGGILARTRLGGRDACLAPTHEEAAAAVAAQALRSYRQLPAILYQLQTKVRDEARPRGGLLRTREFTMKDAYSFDLDESGLETSYAAMAEAYERIFARLDLDVIAVESDLGMMGGSGAHEFMALLDVGEDSVILCSGCGWRANRQVADADGGDPCRRCGAELRAARAVEVGNIFRLGTRYSEALGASVLDSAGRERPLVMGSYGIGPARAMACLVEAHRGAGERSAIRWPRAVAPFAAHVLALGRGAEVADAAERVYRELRARGVDALVDDRGESAGASFADADLIGAPARVVVGARTLTRGVAEVDVGAGREAVPLERTAARVAEAIG